MLLESGASVDMALTIGATPLHIAAENEHGDVGSKLLNASASVDMAR